MRRLTLPFLLLSTSLLVLALDHLVLYPRIAHAQSPMAASIQPAAGGRFQLLYVPKIDMNAILDTEPEAKLLRIDASTGEVSTLNWIARPYPKGSALAGKTLKAYYWRREISETEQQASALLATADFMQPDAK